MPPGLHPSPGGPDQEQGVQVAVVLHVVRAVDLHLQLPLGVDARSGPVIPTVATASATAQYQDTEPGGGGDGLHVQETLVCTSSSSDVTNIKIVGRSLNLFLSSDVVSLAEGWGAVVQPVSTHSSGGGDGHGGQRQDLRPGGDHVTDDGVPGLVRDTAQHEDRDV